MKNLINYILAIAIVSNPFWIKEILPEKSKEDSRDFEPTQKEIENLNSQNLWKYQNQPIQNPVSK